MTKPKHTEGPWLWSDDGFLYHPVLGGGVSLYVLRGASHLGHILGTPANKRLVAAAPDLLDALIRLREWVRHPGKDDGPENEAVILEADAAIAKATET